MQKSQQWQQARQQPELLWGCPKKQASGTHNAKNQNKSFKGSPANGCPKYFPFLTIKHKEKRKFFAD